MIPWTPAEDVLLRQHYASMPIKDLAEDLMRSVAGVCHRARKLGLRRPDRGYTPAEDARLRQAWGKVRTCELARELGRSPNALKLRAMKLGLDSERYYTDAEKELLCELYPTHTAAEIAQRIHGDPRRASAIYRMAGSLGLKKRPHAASELLEQVRSLHAAGHPDRVVAQRLGLEYDQAKHFRRRLGLPTHRDIESKRAGLRKQYATLGIRTAGELRRHAYRKYARENGWPEDLRPRAVQVLNLLASSGVPLSREQIALGIGMRIDYARNPRRKILRSNDPEGSYLAHLAARGLVTILYRALTVTGEGKGHSRHLYCLGPVALSILQRRSECEMVNATH